MFVTLTYVQNNNDDKSPTANFEFVLGKINTYIQPVQYVLHAMN